MSEYFPNWRTRGNKARQNKKNPGCGRGFSSLTTRVFHLVMRRRWKTQKTGKLHGFKKNPSTTRFILAFEFSGIRRRDFRAWRKRTPKNLFRSTRFNELRCTKQRNSFPSRLALLFEAQVGKPCPAFPLPLAHRPRTHTASNLLTGRSSSFSSSEQRLWRSLRKLSGPSIEKCLRKLVVYLKCLRCARSFCKKLLLVLINMNGNDLNENVDFQLVRSVC